MADFFGSEEDDYFVDTTMSDLMFGGAGNDRLRGGDGADTLFGEAGRDDVRGDRGDDVLSGGEGDDALRGGEGNDILRSEAGVDRLDGGEGFDRISFFVAAATAGAIVDLATQTVENDGFGNREVVTSIEGLGLGTVFADIYVGDDGANFLWIDAGDTAIGGGGNDSIRIGSVAGATIDGGAGEDVIEVDNRTAILNAQGQLELVEAERGVVIDLGRERMTDGFGATARIVGMEGVVSSTKADRLTGSDDNNFMIAFAGDDRLFGLGGRDTLYGDEGDDLLEGGDGDDLLIGDFFAGELGQDTLVGGEGSDTLIGAGGIDRLFGGAGSDFFTFRPDDTGVTRETADRVLDFQQTDGDRIEINIGGIGSIDFIGTNAFTGAIGEVRYETRGGDTFVYAEVDGQAGADIVIRLAGESTLTANDFQL